MLRTPLVVLYVILWLRGHERLWRTKRSQLWCLIFYYEFYICTMIHAEWLIATMCAKRLGLVESRNGTSIIFVLEKDAFVFCYFRSSWIYVRNVLILDYYFFFLRTSFPIQVTSDLTNRWNNWKTVYSCFQLFLWFPGLQSDLKEFQEVLDSHA